MITGLTGLRGRLADGSLLAPLVAGLLLVAGATITSGYAWAHSPALSSLMILGVIGVAGGWGGGRDRQLDRRVLALSAAFLAYALVAVLSAVRVGLNPQALDRLENFIPYLAGAFLVVFLARLRLEPRIFWLAIGAAALLSGVFAIGEFIVFGPEHRAAGSKGKAIPFGEISTLVAVLSALGAAMLWRTRQRDAWFLALAASLGALASLMSGTRGAWVFLPTAFVVILGFLVHGDAAYWRRRAIGVLVLGLALILALAQLGSVRERFGEAFAQLESYHATGTLSGGDAVGERLEMWRLGLSAFQEAPLLGIGVGQLNAYFHAAGVRGELSPVVTAYDSGRGHTHAHNELIHTLATRGLLGALSLAALLGVPLWIFVGAARAAPPGPTGQGMRGLAYAGVLVILGFAHFSLTDSVLLFRITAGYFVLLVCWLTALVVAADAANTRLPSARDQDRRS